MFLSRLHGIGCAGTIGVLLACGGRTGLTEHVVVQAVGGAGTGGRTTDRTFTLGGSLVTGSSSGGVTAGIGGTRMVSPSSTVAVGSGGAAAVTTQSVGGASTSSLSKPKLRATAISVGGYHVCALIDDGSVSCWGSNYEYLLGDGTQNDSTEPVRVRDVDNAITVVVGLRQSFALKSDGRVLHWGGSMGASDGIVHSTSGVDLIPINDPVSALASGHSSACAIITDGTVRCWGLNIYGALGDGTSTNSVTPKAVVGVSDAVGIACGDSHCCTLLRSGEVNCWGHNQYGELGNGKFQLLGVKTPTSVVGIRNAVAISAGGWSSCAALSTGEVMCWGNGQHQQFLGLVNDIGSPVPVTIPGVTGAVQLTTATTYSCALLQTGEVVCWGDSSNCRIGTNNPELAKTPHKIEGLANVTAVSAAGASTCALLSTGEVQCWGANLRGLLGIGKDEFRCSPVTVNGF